MHRQVGDVGFVCHCSAIRQVEDLGCLAGGKAAELRVPLMALPDEAFRSRIEIWLLAFLCKVYLGFRHCSLDQRLCFSLAVCGRLLLLVVCSHVLAIGDR